MRVTEKMLFGFSMDRLQKQASGLLKAQERSVTGKRVTHASDDPVAASRALGFKRTIAQMDQRLRNVTEAERFLSISEETLKDVEGELHKASELAIDMASASKTPLDRKNAIHELQQIFDQLVSLANTKHDGQSLFAGNKVDTIPFDFEAEWKGQFIGKSLPANEDIVITKGADPGIPSDPNFPVNDVLNVTVDGINIQVVLEQGTFDGATLANDIQVKINAHPDMVRAEKAVTVGFELDHPDDPDFSPSHFVITSDTIGGRSSVVANAPTGIKIDLGMNDSMEIIVDGQPVSILLSEGIYKEGTALAVELEGRLADAGQQIKVQFDTDHFVLTPFGGKPFVHPLPQTLPFGDARLALGFIDGKSRLSGEEYHGDEGEMPVWIEPDRPFTKNLTGIDVFKGGSGNQGVDLFADLLNLKTALDLDDNLGVKTAVAAMNKAVEQISTERAGIGAKLNRVESTRITLEEAKVSMETFRSGEEDIDLAKAISELVQQQNALEATRSVAARILEAPTLLNFLR
jgi:flagellar hook-associated protein 3 FlgL